jgi:6-phosphogluconolactonase (cycloisomerase 2 family)
VADAATGSSPGGVSVLAIGTGGSLTEVPGSPFILPAQVGGTTPSPSALAVTPTVYPPAFAICSANVPPTTENLYVTDSVNYVILNYSVASTGVLTLVPTSSTLGLPTGTVPSGVTVDPCNRFVYVSNGVPNNSVSAYTVCSATSFPTCTQADFSLRVVTGSPFAAGNAPGPLMMDAYANFLYVVNTMGNSISGYRVSTTTGSLSPLSPAITTTNSFPTSIAIRSDDTWMFVTNLNSLNVSQYAITPSSGSLTPQPPVETDNFPWGVAVK